MSQSFSEPVMWNSLGPIIVPYTVGFASMRANARASGSGQGSRRQT